MTIARGRSALRRWTGEWGALAAIGAAYALVSLAWCVALPLWQGTDEAAHFGLMQFIAENGRLPGRTERYRTDEIVLSGELSDAARLPWDPTQRQSFGPESVGPGEDQIAALDPALRTSFERQAVNQVMLVPPLYGVLGSLAYRAAYGADMITRAFAVRLYAIALGGGVLALVYLLARELWPERKALWGTLTLLVAFQPQFMYSAAGGTSDVLAALWFALLTWQMVHAVRRGMSIRLAVGMGVALGLGLLTKPHLFMAGPAMALLFIVLWLRGRGRRWRVAACAAIVAVIGLAFWGAWGLRSWQIHGNPFYDTLWAGGWGEVENPQFDYALLPYLRDYALSLCEGLLASYWGLLGYLDTPLPPAVYRVLLGLTGLSALGWVRQCWRRARRAREERAGVLAWVLLAVLAITPVVYMGVFNYDMWRTAGIGWPLMGRHLAGPLAAQMALWVAGLLAWMPQRLRPVGHVAMRAGMLALNAAALLVYLLPRYYR